MAKEGGLKTSQPRAQRTYQSVDIADLSGGLDLRRSATLLQPDRARVLRNYSLATPGELAVRPGYRAFSTTMLGSSGGQGGQRVYLANAQFSLFAWGGAIYRPPDAGSASSVIEYSTLSDTGQVYFPFDRVLVAALDGMNRPVKSTGDTTWTSFGIDASTAKSTASSVSNGNLSASEFEFTFSYKDRGTAQESNISTLVSTLTFGATGGAEIQVPNSSDGQVDAIVIYARNKTAGESVLRKATSGAIQNTTAAGQHSTIRVLSSAWSANDEAPTNHNPPGAWPFAVIWKNRWWAPDPTIGNRLHFTELFQNQSWPTLFYIDLPFERGDRITALIAQGDTLLVFGQSRVYLIIGQTSLDFEVKPSAGAQAGALGPRCVVLIENGVVHASAEGIFIFDGATDKYLSFDIEPAWRDLMKNGAASLLPLISLTYHFPYKELRISVPRLFPRSGFGEFVLDLNRTRESQRPAWTDTDRTIGGYISWDGSEQTTGNRGRLLSWDSTSGQLFEEAVGTSANSSNMTAQYEGAHVSMGSHRARFIDHRGHYEPNDGNFAVEVFVDGVSQGSQTIGIGGSFAVIGTALIGTAVIGGIERKEWHKNLPLKAEGRTVWMTNSYVGQSAFRQFTHAIGMVPESKPRDVSD